MMTAVDIVNYALSIGYEKCGIINISAMKGYAEKLQERIDRFPEVKGKQEKLFDFANLEILYPWAKSIVVCASWYGTYDIPPNVQGHIAKYYLLDGRRNVNSAEYKRSIGLEQYLVENGLKLITEREFGITALRWAAMQAGMGIVRKNNFFYVEKGSWISLEAFLIDAELEYINKTHMKKCPEHCNLCIKSCPTKSLIEPYMMCRNSCISCLTTWDGWDLTTNKYSKDLGRWIFGCDACQDVCPFNHGAWSGEETFLGLDELCQHLSLAQIVVADYRFLQEKVQPKLWYIPSDKLWRYKTNALNALLNDFKPEYIPLIKTASADEHPEVRKMAKWVLSKLNIVD